MEGLGVGYMLWENNVKTILFQSNLLSYEQLLIGNKTIENYN